MPVVRKRKLSTPKNLLSEIYFNAQRPGSFGGVNHLAKVSKLPQKTVQKFLSQQWTYQFHKPVRNKFPRRRYIVRGVNEQWQADLVEMQHFHYENKGYRYILCVIDVFSRYVYTRPLKNKTGKEVADALDSIFEITFPKRLQTDQGNEFYNQHVRTVLEKYGIELFSVYSDKKAAIVERFQRTLKERMYRAFTYQSNHKWLDLLPKLTESYNHSYHRSIKTMPANINKTNETAVWLQQYGNIQKNPVIKFQIGDTVRIPKTKTPFSKGYEEKWTDEIFTISFINTKYKPELYTLVDSQGETISGSFYSQELQKVDNQDNIYRIEKVLQTKTIGKRKHSLVKWKGYKEPTWIDSAAIQNI